jgi:hypothetical protein
LPPGAIHPDLVNRLAEEACKAAGHVLTMCVRALDYCPPVDLTFGEYLRALITADIDVVPDDDRNYRLAFVEAFRRRGIYPRDVRSLSVESLRWRQPVEDQCQPSDRLTQMIARIREQAEQQLYARNREDIFKSERQARGMLHELIEASLMEDPEKRDAAFLGLNAGESFEVHAAHFAARIGPDGDLLFQLIMQITQERRVEVGNGQTIRVEGGCTLVADLIGARVAYCIRKPLGSETRLARQREFLRRFTNTSLRSTYFGSWEPGDVREPFALLHRAPL